MVSPGKTIFSNTLFYFILYKYLVEEEAALLGESRQNNVEHLEQLLAIAHLDNADEDQYDDNYDDA